MAAAAKAVLGRLADVGCVAWGGYEGAERRRLVVGKEELGKQLYFSSSHIIGIGVRGQL